MVADHGVTGHTVPTVRKQRKLRVMFSLLSPCFSGWDLPASSFGLSLFWADQLIRASSGQLI